MDYTLRGNELGPALWAVLFGLIGCGGGADPADGRGGAEIADPGGPQHVESGAAGEGAESPFDAPGAPGSGPAATGAVPCVSGADCGPGRVCNPEGLCELSGECGASEFAIEDVPPNVMVLLDRSCSMPQCTKPEYASVPWVPFHQCSMGLLPPNLTDKWGDSIGAITSLTMQYPTQIRWGLQFFPDNVGDWCTLEPPSVAPGPDTGAAVRDVLTRALDPTDLNFPNGPCNTMTSGALEAMAAGPYLQDAARGNYVVLITDGGEFGCGATAAKSADAATRLADMGVGTFVVGFGGEVLPASLNTVAEAGGLTNAAGPQKYFEATNEVQLSAALSDILGSVVGCAFALDSEPPNREELYAFLDDELVARDSADGWSYDAANNQVVFQGAACAALQSGGARDIDIVFGCPEPVLE